jgi:quercetin dioxygenase-like cupin family protein
MSVTVMRLEEMESTLGGVVIRARASLGVTAWGMQVMDLPPGFEYPAHNHDEAAPDPMQEEVYVPLAGSATLELDDESYELTPGTFARVGPHRVRRLVPGDEGIRCLVIGGVPGSFSPPPWTELGGPLPKSP